MKYWTIVEQKGSRIKGAPRQPAAIDWMVAPLPKKNMEHK